MKNLIKFITCGSVDDGKSTLIGHMLYDTKLIFLDQKRALEIDSKLGSNNGDLDYSLLLDGLMAEREQGITIDVAYRYFTTEARSFIVADCPGHEQYTRNMAVGASFADVALLLVDATKGLLLQTKRHGRICAMMGIKHFMLVVNKMDLVHYDNKIFSEINHDFKEFCANFELETLEIIPVSATVGDNINNKSQNTPWYKGKPLLECLENIEISSDNLNKSFSMNVQRVCRPNLKFRGYQGEISTGKIKLGDEIEVLPQREKAKVKEILIGDKKSDYAQAGQAITLALDKEIDVSRGSVITNNTNVEKSHIFSANILWLDDEDLLPGRSYLLKIGTKLILATILHIKYKTDVNTGKCIKAESIAKNEFVSCDISVNSDVVISDTDNVKDLSRFILINRLSNATCACGIIKHSLRRSSNIQWQDTEITRQIRANQKAQKPITLWFTGLSGSGKSAIANGLEKNLVEMGKHTMLLDGDNIRHGLNKDLGFTTSDRIENIRRIAEVSKLFNDAGIIVLTAFISPFEQDREAAREIIGKDDFVEIYVATPLDECERRDVKGLYKKARNGEIPNFTGVSHTYEAPKNADIVVDTMKMGLDEVVEYILSVISL